MYSDKRNIRLYTLISLFQGMIFYGPIATLYRQANGLTVFDITVIESVCGVLTLALEVPWGIVADKIGYRKTLVICCVLYFISKLVFWRADRFGLFLLERILLAVVISGMSGCDSAFLFLSAGGENTQKIFGRIDAMNSAGLVIASLAFTLTGGTDFRLAGLLTVFSYGAAMVLSLLLREVKISPKEPVPFRRQMGTLWSAVKSNRSFLWFLLGAALLAEANQTITVFLNQLEYLRCGIPTGLMGPLYIAVTLFGIVSACSHRLSGAWGEGKLTILLFSGAAAACLAMAFLPSAFIAVAGILLLRVCSSLFVPLRLTIQNRQVKVAGRATMLSVYSIVMNLVAVGTNLIFGKTADIGVEYALFAGAVFCTMGLMFYLIWRRVGEKNAG